MRYESNPKHSDPWQPGRRGTPCPKEVRSHASELLEGSVLLGSKRYATHNGVAYCAQLTHTDVWHGYPVGWKHVPHALRRRWRHDGKVRKREINSKLGLRAIMPRRWERLAGDTDVFAFKVAFMDDPDGGAGADDDLSHSWGAFQIWVGGSNLCAHLEQGENVESVHWYLLPLLEWIANSWDPLFHEERLPCANAASDAWSGLGRTAFASSAIEESEEAAWEEQWQAWWSRHAITAASEGGIFPDIVLRRCRDLVEVSWGNTKPVGTPEHVSFAVGGPAVSRLRPTDVAVPLYEIIQAGAEYLGDMLPGSSRVLDLKRKIRRIRTRRLDGRLMWLAGAGPDREAVQRGWNRMKRWLSELPQVHKSTLLAATGGSSLVVEGSCHAALMYGSVAPTIEKQDMLTLAGAMVDLYSTQAERENLASLCRAVPLADGEVPWMQGYALAEDIHDRLGTADAFDILATLDELGVEVLEMELADSSVRGLAVAGPHHRPGIAWNSSCPFNETSEGQRFTFAHELCHILFDRQVGTRLAIASGRWAPIGIEQRANAFAAMLLMPTTSVRAAVRALNGPIISASDVAVVATRLQTGFGATLWHLRNLGVIDDFDRQRIQASTAPTRR